MRRGPDRPGRARYHHRRVGPGPGVGVAADLDVVDGVTSGQDGAHVGGPSSPLLAAGALEDT